MIHYYYGVASGILYAISMYLFYTGIRQIREGLRQEEQS
jgi:hypothetical protein